MDEELFDEIEEIKLKVQTASSVDVDLIKKSFDELTESFDSLKAEAEDIEAAKNELVEINDKMDDAIAASVTADNAATTATAAATKAEEAKAEAANSAQQAVTATNLTQQNVLESSQYAYKAQQSAKAAKESETVAAGLVDEAKEAAEQAKQAEENALAAAESVSIELAENYALKSEIPTIPTNVSEFNNDVGYLTEHQDLSEYAKLEDIANFATTDQIPDVSEFITAESLSEYAKIEDLESAGKVKSVNNIEPDENGNIELDIETGGNLEFSYENENLTLAIDAKGSVFIPTDAQIENLNRDHRIYATVDQIPELPDISKFATVDMIGDIEAVLDNLLS